MKKIAFYTLIFLLYLSDSTLHAQFDLELESFATGFSSPVAISNAGDDRLFIVERSGRIKVLNADGTTQSTDFLDIDPIVRNTGGQSEQGLLGLAFHPDYKNNGYFFVNYTDNSGDTQISRFSVNPMDSTTADPNSEVIIMTIDQPFSNHNGGDLTFGPDGYLYIGTGDGGSANDPGNRSQNRQTLLGKMLRIDIDNGSPYAIPADNPFVNDGNTLDEIWALGLRNPWRHTFDRLTGDFWIADVGQGRLEEVNYQAANSAGGENYGWRCYEGTRTFNTSGCGSLSEYTLPAAEYDHDGFTHCSVTGGYVYRGTEYPAMYGHYIFADYCSGRFWATRSDGSGGWETEIVGNFSNTSIVSFGQDIEGELYVASLTRGQIYKLSIDICSAVRLAGSSTDITCTGETDGTISLDFETDADDYQLTWTPPIDSLTSLAAGTYTVNYTDTRGCEFSETFTIRDPGPLTISGNVLTASGDSLIATVPQGSNYTIQWTLNGDPIPGATDPVYVPMTSGTYGLIFFTSTGCEVTVADTEVVVISSIESIAGIDKFTVRPSLFRESLIIELETPSNLEVNLKLISNSGQVIRNEQTQVQGIYQQIWMTDELPAGIYFIQLNTLKGTVSEKVVKVE